MFHFSRNQNVLTDFNKNLNMKFYNFGFEVAAVIREDRCNTNLTNTRISYMLWELVCHYLLACSKYFFWIENKTLQIPLTMKHFTSCYFQNIFNKNQSNRVIWCFKLIKIYLMTFNAIYVNNTLLLWHKTPNVNSNIYSLVYVWCLFDKAATVIWS